MNFLPLEKTTPEIKLEMLKGGGEGGTCGGVFWKPFLMCIQVDLNDGWFYAVL